MVLFTTEMFHIDYNVPVTENVEIVCKKKRITYKLCSLIETSTRVICLLALAFMSYIPSLLRFTSIWGDQNLLKLEQ